MQQREAVVKALRGGSCPALVIHMSLEHEKLHQETLCYMLAQQQKETWRSIHLQEDGAVLQNGVAFEESMARVRDQESVNSNLQKHCPVNIRISVSMLQPTAPGRGCEYTLDLALTSSLMLDAIGPNIEACACATS